MITFEQLEQLLPSLAFDDDKAGGALTIFKDGVCVVDAAFGQANAAMAWTPRTLSLNFSIGKGVLATLIAVLVSDGVLAYDRPISDYWAEFGTNGKQKITLIDVLSHRAGLYHIASVVRSNDELGDWQAMLQAVASMAVATPKDQDKHHYASAYSALVSGWILGGVIERATGETLQAVLEQKLAAPLGLAGELYFGLPSALHDNLALPSSLFFDRTKRVKPVLKQDSDATKALFKALPIADLWQQKLTATNQDGELTTQRIGQLYFDSSMLNLTNYKNALLADNKTPVNYYHPMLLSSPIPAANGISTSHALATLYAMHANDGVWGDKVLIKPATLRAMRQIYSDGADAVMPANMHWRAGFHRLFSVQSANNAYGHMGYNGSVAFCDPDRRLAVAFIHNFETTMLNDIRQFVVSEMALLAK